MVQPQRPHRAASIFLAWKNTAFLDHRGPHPDKRPGTEQGELMHSCVHSQITSFHDMAMPGDTGMAADDDLVFKNTVMIDVGGGHQVILVAQPGYAAGLRAGHRDIFAQDIAIADANLAAPLLMIFCGGWPIQANGPITLPRPILVTDQLIRAVAWIKLPSCR